MSTPFPLRAGRAKVTSLFLAGPMSGVPGRNFPLFFGAAELLEAAGYRVVNPAAGGQVEGWVWEDYLRRSIPQLLGCDGMAVLMDWQTSRGTLAEAYVAAVVGMPVAPVSNWLAQDWTTGEQHSAEALARMGTDLPVRRRV